MKTADDFIGKVVESIEEEWRESTIETYNGRTHETKPKRQKWHHTTVKFTDGTTIQFTGQVSYHDLEHAEAKA